MKPSLAVALLRALRLRCPYCRLGPLFRGFPNRMHRCCPVCGLSYFRESGYYLGGMIATYVLTVLSLLVIYLASLALPEFAAVPENVRLGSWVALAGLLTLLLMRPGYSLWLALDFWIEPWSPPEPPE